MRVRHPYPLTFPREQQGFSLLEMVLSAGLASVMMMAISASLVQFNHHKLLAQMVVRAQSQEQLAVAQVLTDWRGLCGLGVISGTAHSLALMRPYQGSCVQYDYGYEAHGHSLTRRRLGGRNSGFLAQVEAMELYYGVDSNKDCRIDQWRHRYQTHELAELHQVRVFLQLRLPTSQQLRVAEVGLWNWHPDEAIVLHPVNFIWRLTNVCH
jgi:hypothetical protein|tara:strand:- start:2398 stop:3027 length:630 start_codon:yes stop_codon:yes gene_type:complete